MIKKLLIGVNTFMSFYLLIQNIKLTNELVYNNDKISDINEKIEYINNEFKRNYPKLEKKAGALMQLVAYGTPDIKI